MNFHVVSILDILDENKIQNVTLSHRFVHIFKSDYYKDFQILWYRLNIGFLRHG